MKHSLLLACCFLAGLFAIVESQATPADGTSSVVISEILDRVAYGDGTSDRGHDAWPAEADGQGASLHRVLTAPYGNSSESWFAGPPTPGF